VLIVLIAMVRVAVAQSAPPDMKNVTVESGGTAVIAPVTVNMPKPQTIVVPAPEVRFAPQITVAPAAIPDEMKVKLTESTYLRGGMDVTITSMPSPPESESWCIRNPFWCVITGAAVIGAGVGVADHYGAFDSTVSFK